MFDKLTKRELDILHMIAIDRLTVNQVGEKLLISKRTVHFHLQNVYKKCNISDTNRHLINLALDYSEYYRNLVDKE